MPQRRRLDDAFANAETIGPPVAGQSDLPANDPDSPLSGNFADFLLSLLSPVADPLGAITGGGTGGATQAMGKIIGKGGRVPGWLKQTRIPSGQQNVDAASKIPRFRSPAGDFVKFEDKWWRIKPFRADATDIALEWLGPGAQEVGAKVLESRKLPMRDFYDSVLKSKAAQTPKRRAPSAEHVPPGEEAIFNAARPSPAKPKSADDAIYEMLMDKLKRRK